VALLNHPKQEISMHSNHLTTSSARPWLSRSVLAAMAGFASALALAGPSAVELEIVQNAKLSLAQAIVQVERETNGAVVEAELDDDDDMFFYELEVATEQGVERIFINPASELDRERGTLVYEVKTIQQGREHDVELDAQSGEILEVDEDD
jgi:uncharacterized membrane protein YkoI